MISKYISLGLGAALLLSGALIWHLNNTITDLNKEIGQLEVQAIACQASNDNLVKGIEESNAAIDRFNIILKTKNKVLASITNSNAQIQEDLERKLHTISAKKTKTCEETMDWMLTEALNENNSDSTQ